MTALRRFVVILLLFWFPVQGWAAMTMPLWRHANRMGYGLPNMIGVNTAGLDAQIQKLPPSYLSMGQAGRADMGDMSMPAPDNSVATVVVQDPFDPITMGGMFTIVNVRDKLEGTSINRHREHPERHKERSDVAIQKACLINVLDCRASFMLIRVKP